MRPVIRQRKSAEALGEFLPCLLLAPFQSLDQHTHGQQCPGRGHVFLDHLLAEALECMHLYFIILEIAQVVLQALEHTDQPLDLAAREQALEEFHQVAQFLRGLAQFV